MAIVTLATAEHYPWGDGCEAWYLLKTDDLHVIAERMPPHAQEVRHKHTRSRQLFFVLEGTLTLEVEEVIHQLEPYYGFEVAPGDLHQAFNRGATDLRFLVISCPPSHGDRTDA